MSRRVLVVDDDRQMVQTLRDVLELSGWTSEGAYTGREAVAAVNRGAYDAVLMDIRMPDMDGVTALKTIRTQQPRARVILMTAFTAPELIREAESEGALRVLAKPVALAPLLDLLRQTLQEASSVLIIDDEPAFLTTLSDLLVHRGYTVIPARTLEEAIEAIRQQTPGAVLLHLRLGNIAPATSILTIRRVSPSVALILYSGQLGALTETTETVPPGWVQAQLQKPFPVERLTALLDGVIAR